MTEKEPLGTESYKGVRDFYPADWAVEQTVFTTFRTVLASFGYEEYNASPLERAELYESKGNEEIVRDQTYTFTDRGDRRVTLRPEMTPTLARMVAGKRRELPLPLRWFSIPNVFRYERPQRGRLREHYQLNVDLLGLPSGEADIEAVTLASELLRAFGATDADFTIRVNSRALLSAACKAAGYTDEDGVREYWHLLDRKSKMSAEEFAAARPSGGDPLQAIEDATDETVAHEKAALETVLEVLKHRGITNALFDPEIVRGFDYYTGLVFELTDNSPENPRSLMGGGRYDGLVSLFGGDPIPAVGFGAGDVGFIDFLTTHNLLPETITAPQIFIGTPTPENIPAAQTAAATLRAQGLRVFVNLTAKSLGDQIQSADRRGIPYFIAYGETEVSSGSVKIKELSAGTETVVSLADIGKHIGA